VAADAVLAISEYGRREIIEEFGLPPEKVNAVHLGVDAAFFGRPAPRPRSAPYFLCTGSDYPHKNLPLLLRSYAWLRTRWKDAPELVLSGHRTKTPGIYELGPEPAPGVRYLGEVDRDALPALYLDELSMDELADRMRAAATDSTLRTRLIEAGRERVKRFTWEQTAAKTVEVYRRTTRG